MVGLVCSNLRDLAADAVEGTGQADLADLDALTAYLDLTFKTNKQAETWETFSRLMALRRTTGQSTEQFIVHHDMIWNKMGNTDVETLRGLLLLHAASIPDHVLMPMLAILTDYKMPTIRASVERYLASAAAATGDAAIYAADAEDDDASVIYKLTARRPGRGGKGGNHRQERPSKTCTRCGRDNHDYSKCFANKSKAGVELTSIKPAKAPDKKDKDKQQPPRPPRAGKGCQQLFNLLTKAEDEEEDDSDHDGIDDVHDVMYRFSLTEDIEEQFKWKGRHTQADPGHWLQQYSWTCRN